MTGTLSAVVTVVAEKKWVVEEVMVAAMVNVVVLVEVEGVWEVVVVVVWW